jgi:calcineurin-like phosphoesterase family protein
MSRDIWISSDLHLQHANILKFIDYEGNKVREFDHVNQMDEHLLDRHNSVVKPGDIWYNLGDVFFGDKESFKKLWPKFHGKKRLICGNHDDIPFLSSGGFFSKVQLWRQFPEYELIMTHVPIHESSMYRGKDNTAPMLNVHGHIHRLSSPTRMHYNVSVEALDDYTPIHIEDLAVIARERRNEWREQNVSD